MAFFAREEGAPKAPAALHDAVKQAGGQVAAEMTVKPWELPRWAASRPPRLGLQLDAAAARTLVGQVGERQQRLLRELEKLALEARGAAVTLSAEEIEARAAHSAQWRAYALADALVAGDAPAATRIYLRLREQGERLPGLTYLIAQRLRDAHAVALRLQAGESAGRDQAHAANAARGGRSLHRRRPRARCRPAARSAATLADLELDSRGGAPVRTQPLGGAPGWARTRSRCARSRRSAAEPRDRRPLRGGAPRRACGRLGTSCARRCCGAARRS